MGIFSRLIGISQFASPLGLIGKIATKQKVYEVPDEKALKKGLTISAAGAATASTGGLLLNEKEKEEAEKMGLLDKLKEYGIMDPDKKDKPRVSGGLNFGSASTSGFIPIIIAVAIAFAIAVGGGFINFGKSRKRRR